MLTRLLQSIFPYVLMSPDEGGGSGGAGGEGGGQQTQTQQTQGAAKGGRDDDEGSTFEAPSESTWNDLQRQLRELKRRDAEYARAETERRTRQGEFQQLYEDERNRADGLQTQLDELRAEVIGTRVAGRLNFKRPDLALKLVDKADFESEDKLSAALKKIAREMPELIAAPARQQRDVTGDGGSTDDMNSKLRAAFGRS